jgi:hypothetical protein
MLFEQFVPNPQEYHRSDNGNYQLAYPTIGSYAKKTEKPAT